MSNKNQQLNGNYFQNASKAHVLDILEHSQIGMWEWDMERDLNYINEPWARMIGYTANELNPITSDSFNRLIHEDDKEAFAAALSAKHANHSQKFSALFRLRHKKGHWIWIKTRGDFIEFKENKPVRMAGIHLEVSALMGRIELERVLHKKLDDLMEGTQVGFYSILPTPPYNLNYVSPNLAAQFNLSLENNADFIWHELLHPDDRDHVSAEFSVWAKTPAKKELARTFRMRNRTGAYQWVEDRCHKTFANGVVTQIVGTVQNVQEFMEKDKLLNRIANVSPSMLYKFERTPEGGFRFPFVNKRILDIYGALPEEVRDDAAFVFERIHPDDLQLVSDSIEKSAENLTDWDCEYRVIRDGEPIWVRGYSTPERDLDGTVAWYGLIMDVTAAKATERKLREYQQQLERIQEIARLGYWRADMKTGDLYWSDIIYEIFGFDKETTTPSVALFNSCVHPDDIDAVSASEGAASKTGIYDVEHRIIRPDGGIRWVHELADFSRTEGNLTGTVRDITERKKLEIELRTLSSTDSLTKIDNRRAFFIKSDSVMHLCKRQGQPVTLIMFDIDHFKHVNDTHGHAKGDEILYKVAQAVKSRLRAMDICARIGGEEFAILLGDTNIDAARLAAEKLRSTIAAIQFIDHDNNNFTVTASFGVTQLVDGEALDELLIRGDKAMYRAKQNGRNQVMLAE